MTPMNKPRRPLVLLGLAAVACLVAFAAVRRPPPEAAVAADLPRCRFSAGEDLAYTAQGEASTGLLAAQGTVPTMRIAGTLRLQALSPAGAGGWLLAAALTERHVEPEPADAVRAGLGQPFLLRLDGDCRLAGLSFDPGTPDVARRWLASLVHGVALVLPQGAPPAWDTQEEDTTGVFLANYRRAGEEAGAPVIQKRRLQYRGVHGAQGAAVDVVSASARLVLDPDGRWLRAGSSQEELRVRIGGEVIATVHSRTLLTRTAAAPFPFPGLRPGAFVTWRPADAPSEVHAEAADPALRAVPPGAALDAFAARLDVGGEGALKEAMDALVRYLRARPEVTGAVLDRLDALRERQRAALFLALELAGTPESQGALRRALLDPRVARLDRLRAAAALADVPRPSAETVAALRAATADRDDEIAGAALRGAGVLAHRDPALRAEVRGLLAGELRDARGDRLLDVLDGIGNSGDSELAAAAARLRKDQAPRVRAQAAEALRRMEPAVAARALVPWLAEEQDPRVRAAIARSLAESAASKPTEDAIAAAARHMPGEVDALARAALIQILGTAAGTSALARAALIAHFPAEPLPDLQVLIGRYIPANELG